MVCFLFRQHYATTNRDTVSDTFAPLLATTRLTALPYQTSADYKLLVQDPAYNMPGVPLDRGVYNSFSETFENGNPDMMYGQSSEIDCAVGDVNNLAMQEDCYAALATGMMHPVVGLLQGRNRGQWWASVSFASCFIDQSDIDVTAVRTHLCIPDRVRTRLDG